MIIVDKSKSVQSIILTLSELTTIQGVVKYLMVLNNDATNEINEFYLIDNVSQNKERYDLFYINTSNFDTLTSGYYTYTIYQQSLTATQIENESDFIETGKLLIKDVPAVNNDQFIIYNLNK